MSIRLLLFVALICLTRQDIPLSDKDGDRLLACYSIFQAKVEKNKAKMDDVLANHSKDSNINNKILASALVHCFGSLQLSVARFMFKNGKVVDKTVIEEWHEYTPIAFDRFKTEQNDELNKEEESVLALLTSAQKNAQKTKQRKQKVKKTNSLVVLGYDLNLMPKELKALILVTLVGTIIIGIAYMLRNLRESESEKKKN